MAAMKTFANPGIDIVKTLPEGIVELVLRGVAIVSKLRTQRNQNIQYFTIVLAI